MKILPTKEWQELLAVVGTLEEDLQLLFKDEKSLELYESIAYHLSSKSKRLRPMLGFLVAKTLGYSYRHVYHAAVAAEIAHNFSLVHDDIMDKSYIRRGKESLHVKYGVNMAILAGDTMLACSYLELLKNCNSENSQKILRIFTESGIKMSEGQALDLEFENRRTITTNEYLLMVEKKTAALTEACCRISSELCNAKSEEVEALSLFGKYLGIAFQIQDDFLDTFGDEVLFGKEIGKDLLEGKKNYLFVVACEQKIEGYTNLVDAVERKSITKDTVNYYTNIYSKAKIDLQAKESVKYYSDLALKELNKIDVKDRDAKEILKTVCLNLTNRST